MAHSFARGLPVAHYRRRRAFSSPRFTRGDTVNAIALPRPRAKVVSWLALALLAVLGGLAYAQQPNAASVGAQAVVHMEYLHQEVQVDAIVQSLNELDGQGWSIFQIVPAWQLKNDNGEATLVARAYQVFGRRPARAAK
jgi:hypothetical protein